MKTPKVTKQLAKPAKTSVTKSQGKSIPVNLMPAKEKSGKKQWKYFSSGLKMIYMELLKATGCRLKNILKILNNWRNCSIVNQSG